VRRYSVANRVTCSHSGHFQATRSYGYVCLHRALRVLSVCPFCRACPFCLSRVLSVRVLSVFHAFCLSTFVSTAHCVSFLSFCLSVLSRVLLSCVSFLSCVSCVSFCRQRTARPSVVSFCVSFCRRLRWSPQRTACPSVVSSACPSVVSFSCPSVVSFCVSFCRVFLPACPSVVSFCRVLSVFLSRLSLTRRRVPRIFPFGYTTRG
jgi:hypothetical protein